MAPLGQVVGFGCAIDADREQSILLAQHRLAKSRWSFAKHGEKIRPIECPPLEEQRAGRIVGVFDGSPIFKQQDGHGRRIHQRVQEPLALFSGLLVLAQERAKRVEIASDAAEPARV